MIGALLLMIDFIKLMDPRKLKHEKSEEIFEDTDWLAETKLNGRRIQCLIDSNGKVSFAGRYAREGNENIDQFCDKFFKIKDDISRMKLPKLTLFDGEIYLPGRPLSETMKIINASNIDDSIKIQEQIGFLHYTIFLQN